MILTPSIRIPYCPRGKGRALAIGILALLTLAGVCAQAECTSEAELARLPLTRLNILLSGRLFTNANRNDVIGAMKIYGDLIGCNMHIRVDPKVEIAETHSELRRRILEGNVDVMVLDDMEFVKLSDAGLVDGVAIASNGGHPLALSYLLLVREQTATLAQLRAKKAVFYLHTEAAESLAWMETLLAKEQLGRAETFFASSQVTKKPTSCVLPLFFSRIDACVVDSRDWELIKEMNPQLGKNLKVLAQSTGVLDGVTAVPKESAAERRKMLNAILAMQDHPAGEQILSVFRSGPLIAYQPEFFASTRAFWNEYAQTLTPAERAAWEESGGHAVPKQFKDITSSRGEPAVNR